MEKFNRGERQYQIKRLKAKRKNYGNIWIKNDPKQLGKIVQYPRMCSCFLCSNKAFTNSIKEQKHSVQSFIALNKKEL